MIILGSSSAALALVVGSANACLCQVSSVNLNAGVSTPAGNNVSISNTTTNLLAGPANGQTTVKFISIYNSGAGAVAITVTHTDGSQLVNLQKLTLGIGYTLVYNEGSGWTLYDALGNSQVGLGPGRFVNQQVITGATTAIVASAGVTKWRVRMVGAGGQGGGGGGTTGFDGSGGGAGAYAEVVFNVVAGTTYTCQVGAGGTTGGTGANGQAGTNTTLTVGGTTVTAPGGGGGLVGTSAALPVQGGAGGAIATNGGLNTAGQPGSISYGSVAADNGSGSGAHCQFGAGGQGKANATATTGASAAALGYGGGGGGGTTTGSATAGGAGANGVISIDELS